MANGADPSAAPAPSASQFKLLGVVTEGRQRGYALIAIDDQPAKPYRVGAPVGETLVLRSVAARSAALATDAQAPASVQLVLPELAPPQTTTPNR
jgi:general secretion pathway protein C